MARGILCILLAVAAFTPLAFLLMRTEAVPSEQVAAATAELVFPNSCLPEPGERSAYLAGCLLAPILLFGLTFALRRWREPRWTESPRIRIGLQVATVGGLFALAWWALRGDNFFELGQNIFFRRPWLAVPIVLALLPACSWCDRSPRGTRWLIGGIVGVSLAGVALAAWMGENDAYNLPGVHFPAVYEPVAQVQLGKDLLVDFDSQYGLYPDFLAPLLAVIGGGVGSFTLLIGVLNAASFALLWWVLRGVVRRPSVAVVGFLALVFNGWRMFQLYVPQQPYYQYFPIRFVFPAAALAFVWSYHQQRSRHVYWLAQFVLACGLLWNFDVGLMALAAWSAALAFDALNEANWKSRGRLLAGHATATAASIVATVACYATIKFLWYGAWPGLGHMLDYQRLFYLTGFYMLPMHLQGAWLLVVLVYLVGMARAAAALTVGDRGPKPALLFAASVLGLGLFSYYQGRSHEECLILCWWPALFLLPILLDELLDVMLDGRHRESCVFAFGTACLVGWFLIGSAASLTAASPALCQQIVAHWKNMRAPESAIEADARLIRQRISPGEGLLVLSAKSTLFQAKCDLPTLAPAPLIQMLWRSKYATLLEALERRPHTWVFIESDYYQQTYVSPDTNLGSKFLVEALEPRLREVAKTAHGTLYEFSGEQATAKLAERPTP